MNNVRKPGEKYGLVIGCGAEYRQSTPEMTWINCDADPAVKADIRWPIGELHHRYAGFFDEIEAKDILEHVPCNENDPNNWMSTLQSWSWCLAPGGVLKVQVPDIEAILKQFHDGNISFDMVNRVIFGTNTGIFDRHYRMFTARQLRKVMMDMGLDVPEAYNLHVCAIVVGRKN